MWFTHLFAAFADMFNLRRALLCVQALADFKATKKTLGSIPPFHDIMKSSTSCEIVLILLMPSINTTIYWNTTYRFEDKSQGWLFECLGSCSMCWWLRTPLIATDVAGRGLDVQARCSFLWYQPEKSSYAPTHSTTQRPFSKASKELLYVVLKNELFWLAVSFMFLVIECLRTWSWWLITPSHLRSRSAWGCCLYRRLFSQKHLWDAWVLV